MSTEIYYFSGTGNSLHIAKELQRELNDVTLIPMVSALKSDRVDSNATTVGFIFPIHCLGIPVVTRRFLHKIKLKPSSYLFAVSSRECSSKVIDEINKILSKQDKGLDSFFSFQMPETYLPVFDVDVKSDVDKKEMNMLSGLHSIKQIITNKEKHLLPDSKEIGMYIYCIVRPIIRFIYDKTRYFNLENKFIADANCSGCKTCSRLCPSNKIEIKNNMPVWNKEMECFHCFACIHFCPARSIQIKNSKTKLRGRYHHPKISVEEIIQQKNGINS